MIGRTYLLRVSHKPSSDTLNNTHILWTFKIWKKEYWYPVKAFRTMMDDIIRRYGVESNYVLEEFSRV